MIRISFFPRVAVRTHALPAQPKLLFGVADAGDSGKHTSMFFFSFAFFTLFPDFLCLKNTYLVPGSTCFFYLMPPIFPPIFSSFLSPKAFF